MPIILFINREVLRSLLLTRIDDTLKPLKESSPHLFKAEQPGGYKPNGGGNPPAANPWKKDSFNLTEQGRIFKENPTQAKELAAAAGVTI